MLKCPQGSKIAFRLRHALATGVIAGAMTLSAMAVAQSLKPEIGPSPPQDAMPLYKGGVDRAVGRLPDIVRDIMTKSQVPGVAVAVVHGGRMVFAKGYGQKVKGDSSSPIDENTVFQIASISKSVSATIAAIAMTRGGKAGRPLRWDDPVRSYLPDFILGNDYVSAQATIGDFFAHRSGLPEAAGDDMEDLGFERRDIIPRLRLLQLNAFRTSYHYANFGTTIGAEAVAAAMGERWEVLASRLLFQPLGMASTSYLHKDFVARQNRALLHAFVGGTFKPVYDRNPDEQAPAGGVSSNVVDLAKWLQLLLAGGKHGKDTMAASTALLPALTPQAVNGRGAALDARTAFYGYGFNVNVNANGRTSMGHSGAFLLGAGTTFQILPSADVGIVVLTNGAPVGAAEAIAARFMDVVQYGEETRDWYPLAHQHMMGFFKPVGDLVGKTPPAHAKPARPLASYVGAYVSPYFEVGTVQVEGDHLIVLLGPRLMKFPLSHWDGDVFALRPGGENAPEGSVSSVKFSGEGSGPRTMVIDYLNAEGQGSFSR
ncbi:serine hydrolase [Labrys okinawensis]|uniref:Serine hydrolase n=2 Tax=Labrys okinawensis TaxID=346911 RepID=A0A2S9Q992_9HYPH|nr:serine hydrolase [Labrys okinawensis]